MISPVTASDLGNFLNMVVVGFEDVLFIGFTAMIAFSVAYGIKRLLVDGQ